jgi:hypothetical protein
MGKQGNARRSCVPVMAFGGFSGTSYSKAFGDLGIEWNSCTVGARRWHSIRNDPYEEEAGLVEMSFEDRLTTGVETGRTALIHPLFLRLIALSTGSAFLCYLTALH